MEPGHPPLDACIALSAMSFAGTPFSPCPPMELLAPAGTLPAFEAALDEGADAVYIGAPGLNARALSRDFTFGEIAAMTEHAHARGKKVYVAMNSLMKEDEVVLALETLGRLADIGPDALILQDVGILYLVRRFFPQLQVHASTLMTVNNSVAAGYLKQLGFERIVLARELSLDEIRTIHSRTDVELEIFIHGAMCFSYSGLCRFSSLHGGKSSLRGQCVQPCRRRYEWLPSGKHGAAGQRGKGGEYLFSMNDLSGIDCLAEARQAGVVSLKIEGRLKTVEYVRNTVRAYRLALQALDAPPEGRAEMLAEAHRCLDASMGRKRSTGFLVAGREDRLIVPRLSGSSGEVVGKVTGLGAAKGTRPLQGVALQVALQAPLSLGDRLRLYEERTGNRWSFTLRTLEVKGRPVERAPAGQTATIKTGDIEAGSLRQPFHGVVFRVDVGARATRKPSALMRRAAQMHPPPLDAETLAKMRVALGMSDEETAAGPRSSGQRQAGRQGGARGRDGKPEWWLKIASLEALALRLPFAISKVLLDLDEHRLEQFLQTRARRRNPLPPLVWCLPPVIGEERLAWYREAAQRLCGLGPACFQVGHVGQAALFAGLGGASSANGPELYGEYSCNVLNSAALRMYAECGLSGVQFSLETDRATLAAALAHFARLPSSSKEKGCRVGLYVHGQPPLFSARLDAPHFQGQRSFVSSRGERFYLDRRQETVYAFSHTTFSLLPYVDDLTRMGVEYFVVDISRGPAKKKCGEVAALLSGRGELPPGYTGNFAGVLA